MEKGKHEGLLFNDSDVYKVIEGAAYTLAMARDEAMEAAHRRDHRARSPRAQQKDGYLDTFTSS